jgi:hypothetical protein
MTWVVWAPAGFTAERRSARRPPPRALEAVDRVGDEAWSTSGVSSAALAAPEAGDALAVGRRSAPPGAAEEALHLGEPGEADRVREPDQAGGLHAEGLGDRGDGAEREVVRSLEGVPRDRLQLLREPRVLARDRVPELFVGRRRVSAPPGTLNKR